MKTSLAIFTAILTTLCSVSTAVGQTPPPASGDAPQPAIPNMPQLYYSVTRDAAFAPIITKPPKDIYILKYHDAFFEMKFEGNPSPTVFCTHNGRPIDYSATLPNGKDPIYDVKSEGGWYRLIIRQVLPDDSGIYNFKVRNDVGEVSASAELRVYGK